MRTTTALLFSLALNLCLIAYFSMQLSAAREQSLMLAPSFNVRAAPSRVACNAVPKRTVAPVKKTAAAVRKTVAAPKKTVAAVKKTVAPPKKTVAAVKKTVAAAKKTVAPPAKKTFAEAKKTQSSLGGLFGGAQKTATKAAKTAVKKTPGTSGGVPRRPSYSSSKSAPAPRRAGK
mmetsp:Transcript_15162/g.21261  ORF Transcript_15162/g.21261 Transcript_15162/m.21261 type:complete len:175 (-) Transcript_15162:374-898(-)